MTTNLSQKLFTQKDGKRFAYADDIKELIQRLKENFEKRLKIYEMKVIHGKEEIVLREHEKRELIKEEINKNFGKELTQ